MKHQNQRIWSRDERFHSREVFLSSWNHQLLGVTGWDTPFPHTTEWDYLPSPERIAEAIRKTQEE